MNRPQLPIPLGEVLAREPVPITTLSRWGSELAHTLAAAHAGGVVHGDVRAEAVTIAVDGTAHLAGFFEQPATAPTHPAPELASGGGPSPASDIYALGTMLRDAGGHTDPGVTRLCARMRYDIPEERPSATEATEELVRLSKGSPPAAPVLDFATRVPGVPRGAGRRRHVGWTVAVAATVVALLLAVGGWWLLGGPPSVTRAAEADPIGDPRTADPCALLDTAALGQFGAAQRYPDMASFVSCTVAIRPGTGETVAVHATLDGIRGPADLDLAPLPRQQAGEITIYHTELGPGVCSRTVLPPTRFRVTFAASSTRKDGGLDSCAVVDTAVRQALPRLVSGSLPRRALVGPPNSLLWVDPCTLLDEAMLRSIPRLRTQSQVRLNGGTVCEWGDNDPAIADPPLVSIFASRDIQVTGKPITINSRRGAIRPSISRDSRVYCRVTLIQRSFPGVPDQNLHETLNVHVHLSVADAADSQCAVATTIAKIASAKLPPPG